MAFDNLSKALSAARTEADSLVEQVSREIVNKIHDAISGLEHALGLVPAAPAPAEAPEAPAAPPAPPAVAAPAAAADPTPAPAAAPAVTDPAPTAS